MVDTHRNRRTGTASESRQAEVVRRYLTGERIAEIARSLGVSHRTIMRDIERARKTWREETKKSYDELLPEKLAELNEIRKANWAGWKRSLEDARSRSRKVRNTPDGITVENAKKREQKVGDPKFLGQLERILRTECELRGLLDKSDGKENGDAPQVQEVVITSQEEYQQFQETLSMEDFKKQMQGKAG